MFKIYCHKTYPRIYLKLGNKICTIFQNNPHNRFRTKLITQSNGLKSILEYPKNPPLPDRFIYRHRNPQARGWFTMFDKTDELGWMNGEVMHISSSDFYPMKDYDAFYIHRLKAATFGKKVGTDFIKFAKNLSVKNGCEGRICLAAANSRRPPHIFYRKMGFDCQDSRKMEILDNAIANFTPPANGSQKVPAPRGSQHWVLRMFLVK